MKRLLVRDERKLKLDTALAGAGGGEGCTGGPFARLRQEARRNPTGAGRDAEQHPGITALDTGQRLSGDRRQLRLRARKILRALVRELDANWIGQPARVALGPVSDSGTCDLRGADRCWRRVHRDGLFGIGALSSRESRRGNNGKTVKSSRARFVDSRRTHGSDTGLDIRAIPALRVHRSLPDPFSRDRANSGNSRGAWSGHRIARPNQMECVTA